MADQRWADAYRGRRVLLTGHTGFKGSWLALWLSELGANVTGYSLPPPSGRDPLKAIVMQERLVHREGNMGDRPRLQEVWNECRPEIVFHLAAQPLVRESYRDPLGTLATNVMGTAHILELARLSSQSLAIVVVSSDKCYENREWVYSYRENDPMGGHDIYSMSKGATELLVSSYRRSFFSPGKIDAHGVALATVRASNVIGGGDWSTDRIVPDCVRALRPGQPIDVRNPDAVRPWQHVLGPLSGYLLLGSRLLSDDPDERAQFCEAWNFGPAISNARRVRDLVEKLIERWGAGRWRDVSDPGSPHEAALLNLSIDKAVTRLGWSPRWDFDATVAHTVDWYKAFYAGENMDSWSVRQIMQHSESPDT